MNKLISSRKAYRVLFVLLFACLTLQGADIKWLRYGSYQAKVASTGDMGEGGLGWAQSGYIPYNGFGTFDYDDFDGPAFSSHAWYLICRNWEDEDQEPWHIKMTGCGQWFSDEIFTVMPVEDDQGTQIHQYVRYTPPTVTVDGIVVSNPYPFNQADHIDETGRIPGTAYAMLESWARTDMGVDLHQRVYTWSHSAHDDYLVYDWTFINTGNVDRDDEIELPGQTLDSLYFFRQERTDNWGAWMSAYGESPGDSLRIVYDYPITSLTGTYDIFGNPDQVSGFLVRPVSVGFTQLLIPTSGTDPGDWAAQPNMWATVDCDLPPFLQAPKNMSEENWQIAYEACRDGYANYPGYAVPERPNQYPGMHKGMRFDELGYKDPTETPETWAALAHNWAAGPYTLAFGDSLRFVFAFATGYLSPEMGWEVGRAWLNNEADDLWPESSWPGGDYGLPDQFDDDRIASDANDLAKDAMVYSAVDSLFRNASSAKWNNENNWEAPIPPAAPSVTVTSSSNYIRVEWGDESETIKPDNADFAGYRVYRAQGNPDPILSNDTLMGSWALIYECGAGTANPTITHSYDDTEPVRGTAYYYYVAAFDDGSMNGPDAFDPVGGKPLESGKYMNRTTIPANLTRPPGRTLDAVRIVPNPFNFGARGIQFPNEDNKIMFYDIPPYCTIKIFSESGDLVKTFHHDDGSGDQVWGIVEEEHSHSTTSTGQIIVSGVYIAYIEVTQDYRDPDTDELLYKKGENTFAKFVVVR